MPTLCVGMWTPNTVKSMATLRVAMAPGNPNFKL